MACLDQSTSAQIDCAFMCALSEVLLVPDLCQRCTAACCPNSICDGLCAIHCAEKHGCMLVGGVKSPLPDQDAVRNTPQSSSDEGKEDELQLMDDIEPIRMCSGATLSRNCGNLRPPAVVTEYMSQGSVKQAIARKAEVVSGNMHRLIVAMDAAKVGNPPPEVSSCSTGRACCCPGLGVHASCKGVQRMPPPTQSMPAAHGCGNFWPGQRTPTPCGAGLLAGVAMGRGLCFCGQAVGSILHALHKRSDCGLFSIMHKGWRASCMHRVRGALVD